MGINKQLRRLAGAAVIAGSIAAPGVAQAQVSVDADAGVAQVTTSSSSTGLVVGDGMRAGTAGNGTALDAGVAGVNVAQNDLSVDAGSAAGVAMTDDLTINAAGVVVVLDDKVVGARTGAADLDADMRRGMTTGLRARPELALNPVRTTSGRTMQRTCRSLSRRQARGLRLTGRQLRVLAGCRR